MLHVRETVMDFAVPEHPSSTNDNRVVNLRTWRRLRAAPDSSRVAPQSDNLERYEQSDEPDDFRHRMTVNAVAFLFVAALVVAGVWLADTLTTMRKNQDCVLSGKRDCSQIDTPAPPANSSQRDWRSGSARA